MIKRLALLACLAFATAAQAQVTLSNDKPVELSSDTLEVQQDNKQAIFAGNVIAKQGGITMRSEKMIVHYTDSAGSAQGVSRIDATGNVVFTNATDTAKGDVAVYNVDAQTLDLTGEVLLTRDKNILKGTRMNYNLATGRSVLTAGNSTVNSAGGAATTATSNGRVHGLFVPGSEK